MVRSLSIFCVLVLLGFTCVGNLPLQDDTRGPGKDQPRKRRPCKVLLTPDGDRLLVANRSSGTISVIDTASLEPVGEAHVADELTDLVHWRDQYYLASDFANGQLVCFLVDGSEISVVSRIPTISFPQVLQLNRESSELLVGGLWSRRICRHSLPIDPQQDFGIHAVRDVPFSVGHLCLLPGKGVLTGDAFGDRWLVLVTDDLETVASGDLDSKRIGGMTLSDEGVITLEQPLNRLARAIRNDVHWGLVIANEVRVRPLAWFGVGESQAKRQPAIPLGGAGAGKADPESICLSSEGEAAITLGGVNKVAVGDIGTRAFAYIAVGTRPVHSCFSGDGGTLFVANQLDDSISVVDVDEFEVTNTISLGEQPELTLADRGERLFFDASLSHDSWMSCHSCHVNGHTTGFRNDNFSDQSFGAPKRVLSLLGHAGTEPVAWNGSAKLAEQVASSIEVTMQGDRQPTSDQVEALVAFINSLPAPPSLTAARQDGDESKIIAGANLFSNLDCARCHQAPAYTTPQLYDVGVSDELGAREFNPPSLIGVSQRQAFLHDARYDNLRDVFVEGRHQLPRDLTDEELDQLLAFLLTL